MSTQEHSVGSDAGDRAVQWIGHHQRRVMVVAAIAFFIVGGVWFTQSARVRRETFAAAALSQARVAAESGNLQLAASDLGRIIITYGKTGAGQEAVILLANVHLQQSQPDLAVSELRDLLSRGVEPHLRGPAAGLLGTALEELGRFGEAADAFEQAADNVPYELIRGPFMMDLARTAAAAGDTGRAAAVYEAIIAADENSQGAVEAKFRLAELLHTSVQ